MRKFGFSIGFLVVCVSLMGQSPCSLKVNKDSIKVYSCKEANSKYKSIKTVFPVRSSFSQLAAMVLDIDNYHEWQKETDTAYVVKKISDREIIYYYEANAPYPASNRDFVIRLTIDQSPNSSELTIHAVSEPETLPHKPGVVRVPFSQARWLVKRINSDYLNVEYTIEIDLGGAVPPWLINMVSHQAPHDTFKAMREKIGKYKGRKVEGIRE